MKTLIIVVRPHITKSLLNKNGLISCLDYNASESNIALGGRPYLAFLDEL